MPREHRKQNTAKLFNVYCPECSSEIDLTSIHGNQLPYNSRQYKRELLDHTCHMGCLEVNTWVCPNLNLFTTLETKRWDFPLIR